MKAKRNIVTERLWQFDIGNFDKMDERGCHNVITSCFEDWEHQYQKHKNFRFEVEHYGYDGEINMNLMADREENDQEYNARIKSETDRAANLKKATDKKKESELKTWQRLNKKFGKLKTK